MKTKYNSEFKLIDTEEKSYFLGLFYSDGCMSFGNKVTISLRDYDKSLLEKLKLIFPFFSLKERRNKMIELYTHSKPLYNDLLNLGCFPRKSFENKNKVFFNIPEHLQRHFVRAYFDGDGSIYKSSLRNLYFLDIVSVSYKIINYINNIFISNNIKLIYREKGLDLKNRVLQNRFLLECHNSSEMYKIKKFFYDDATIYLKRKKDLFNNVIPLKPSREINIVDSGDRGLTCPYCGSHYITLNGKRIMKKSISYRYICSSCKKNYSNYTAPSCSDARRVSVQLNINNIKGDYI